MYLFSMLYAYRQELIARQSQENADAGNIGANNDNTVEISSDEQAVSSTNTLAGDIDRDKDE